MPIADPRTYISDYVAFIQEASDNWIANPANDPATVTGMNSSSSSTPNTLSFSHTISTPAGSDTYTRQANVGVVALVPASATTDAAGGTGTVTATVQPTDATVLAESDVAWLTATVAGNVVTWTAAANTEPQRSGSVRISTGQGIISAFMVTQASGL